MTTTLDTPPTYADVPPVDLDWLAGRALQLATSRQAWRHMVQPADAGRWYAPLAVDEQSEAWLMGWPAWERIELHDHGGSSGAFCVVEGRLLETWVDRQGGGPLRRRRLRPGQLVAFGPDHVHDVVGTEEGQSLSIHVYSPRLRSLNFYEAHWGGRLEWLGLGEDEVTHDHDVIAGGEEGGVGAEGEPGLEGDTVERHLQVGAGEAVAMDVAGHDLSGPTQRLVNRAPRHRAGRSGRGLGARPLAGIDSSCS